MGRYNPRSKPATKAEKAYMDKVAKLPCCKCGAYGV
jgi:hypothetical protein